MRNLLFVFYLFMIGATYGQSCNISSPVVGTHNFGSIPPGSVPIRTRLSYSITTNFSANSNSRIVEVTHGSGFTPILPSIPNTVNSSTNTVRFDLSNASGSSAIASFSFDGTINCSLCTGDNFAVSIRLIEDGVQTCTSNVSSPVWNESLPSLTQSLVSNTQSTVHRGSVVRYRISPRNKNICFVQDYATRMIEIIDQIPQGAVFQQAFHLPHNGLSPVNLPSRILQNNQVAIDINASTFRQSDFFIDIFYPCNFPDNTATNKLSFMDINKTPCESTIRVDANDLTINLTNTLPANNLNPATLTKVVGAPHFTLNNNPGGQYAFTVTFTNTGNFPLTNIQIVDSLPTNFFGNGVRAVSMMTGSQQVGTPYVIEALNNSNQWVTVQNAGTFPNAPNSRAFRLTSTPGHVLMPGQSIQFYVYGHSAPNAFGETIINEANVRYSELKPGCGSTGGTAVVSPEVLNLSATQSYTTANRTPRINIFKQVCDAPCFNPGDEIRFQIHVLNLGNSPLDSNGIEIRDLLPANMTFIGGSERYYVFPFTTTTPIPTKVDCNNGTQYNNREVINPSFIQSGNVNGATNLSWHIDAGQLNPNPNIPSPMPANYLLFSDRIVITFSARLNNTPMPNNTGNNNQITSNRPRIINAIGSNGIYNMCSRDELTAEKLVSIDGTNFSPIVQAPAGSTVRYQIRLTNTGNMPLTQIRVADDMPHVGDRRLAFVGGQQCTNRGSQFAVNANHNTILSAGTLSFFNQHNPCLSTLFRYVNSSGAPIGNPVQCCGTTSASTSTQTPSTQGFYIDLAGMVLQPGQTWTYEFDGVLPANASDGMTSCNSFSYRARRHGADVVLEFGESNDACVTIENEPTQQGCDICSSIVTMPIHGRLTRQQTTSGIAYQTVQNNIRVLAPNTNFNQIRVNVLSYSFESNYDECLSCDKHAFNNVGINGGVFQNTSPFVIVNGQPTAPHNNAQHLNLNTSEVNWSTNRTFNFSSAIDLPIELFLPSFSQMECCKVSADVCVRVTFINDQCEVCERIVCFNTNIVDHQEPKCKCTKQTGFNIQYESQPSTTSSKYPKSIACDGESRLPAGVPMVFSNPRACEGDENCTPKFEWQLILSSNQRVISSGIGSTINFSLPTQGQKYILYVQTYCGNQKCEEPCKITISAVKP